MMKQLRKSGGFFVLMLLSLAAIAQESISGKVVSSSDNTPLPGVSIVIKGTSKGTATDADGTFKVSAPKGATLIFTSLGFQRKEVNLGNQTQITVELTEDQNLLDDVVVVALGTKEEKRSLGYNVQEVKGQAIVDAQRDNFMLGLQGRVAGLQMTPTSGQAGGSAVIQLRGAGSIGNNNQPLYVVDGLPISNSSFMQGTLVTDRPNRDQDYQNRAADINPNDIENITILKGPEAAALYGIEAANGAIVITTKKGAKGKGRISYQGSYSMRDVYRFPDTQKQYLRGFNGVFNPANFSFFGQPVESISSLQEFDNVNNFFEQGVRQSHNVSLEGGSDVATYRLSTNYLSDKGVVPTNKLEQINVKLTGTVQISKKLKATTSFNYIGTDNVVPLRSGTGFLVSLLSFPYYLDARDYLNPDGTRRRTLGDDASDIDNPFFNVNKNFNGSKVNRTLSNLQLDYNLTNWLTLNAVMGADIYANRLNRFQHPESNSGITARGFVENANENSQLLNGTFRATARKTFGKFKTSLMLGTTIDDRRYEVASVYGEQLYLPDFNSINNTLPTTQRSKGTLLIKRLQSIIGTANMNYNDTWYVTLTGRNDWSSTLPVQNNSFFYPSISTSVMLTELPVFQDVKSTISQLKIRAAYAQSGNDAPSYRTRARLLPQTTTGGGFQYDVFGGNENIVPERGESYEIGLESKLFTNRIGFDFTYFNKRNFDQITSQRLSYGTGFILGLLNGGEIRNSGIEMTLNATPVKKKDFSWEINANFTKLENEVISLPAEVVEYYNSDTWLLGNIRASALAPNQKSFYPQLAWVPTRGEGKTTALGGWFYLRNKNGKMVIDPSTGLPVAVQTFAPVGDRNPDFTMGLSNTFRYKNLTLSGLIDIRKGGDVFNGNEFYMFSRGLSTRVLDRLQPYVFDGVLRDGRENTDTPTPNTIQVTPQYRSDFYGAFLPESFVERDINWIRLRDITLRYALPQSFLKKQKVFSTGSIFVSGNELFLITNYTGADPDVSGTSAGTLGIGARGFDYGTLALPRTITVGLNFSL
jgi:TonB-linked SusC/RagA family outer membrane protein